MKKIFLLFAGALMICACSKEFELSNSIDSFLMEVNTSYDESKTAIAYDSGSSNYIPTWTNGDAIQVLEFSNGTKLQEKTSTALTEDCQNASFSVSLGTIEGSDFKYYAVYPATSYGTGGSEGDFFYRLELSDEQTFNTTTFGPGSDLMISGVYSDSETERPTSISLKFKRIGAIVGITVKGMNSGESIESVTISTTDQYLAGYSKYNPTTAEWLGTYSASKRSIRTTPIGTYTTTGTDIIWFRTYGVTLTTDFTISVTTNEHIYTKTIDLAGSGKTIEMKDGGMTKFAVNNLTSTDRSTTKYALVTDAENLNVGDKVIFVSRTVDESSYNYFAAGGLGDNDYLASNSASLDANNYISADGVEAYTLDKSGDNWTLSTADSKLLGATGAKKLAYDVGEKNWTISIANGIATVASSDSSYGTMKYNSSNPRFTTYNSGQKDIYLYTQIPSSVTVSGTPTKTTYDPGDKFNPAGLTVTVKYSDDTEGHTITNGIEWLFDPETLSNDDTSCDVMASYYGTLSDLYTVEDLTVNAKTLSSISVSGTPDEFWKGDTFNRNGMTVTATYNDESTKDVTSDSEFTAPDMTTAGKKTVTVTYQDKEATYEIDVKTIANTVGTAYTVTEAKSIIDTGKDLSTQVYVKGTISKIDSYNSKYGSITYWLDNNTFEVYGGLNKDGGKFSSKDDLVVNSDVTVYGNIKKYSGTYEFDKDNYLVSYLPAATLSIKNLTVKNGDAINPEITTNVSDEYTISYTSNSTDIVTVSENTLTTAGVGTAKITATLSKDGWKSATTTFDVTVTSSATLSSIVISGTLTKTSYKTGESLDHSGLTATGHYSDETEQDLTSSVTWSSNPATFSTTGNVTVTVTATSGSIKGTEDYQVTVTGEFSQTYNYGLSSWSLTNYTDKSTYYLVPSGSDPSVATISGIFSGKTITSDIVVTLNVATFGGGTDPSDSTFSIYNSSDCSTSVTATRGGTLPTSSTYTNATYTITKANASSLTSDIAIKITKPGKQIRLKSIKIEFKYN